MAIEHIVTLLVAFVAGSGFSKLIDIIAGLISKSTSHKRTEIDRMATLVAEAEASARIAARRERIATEWGHYCAIAAIRSGVPESEMPVLDFKDNE